MPENAWLNFHCSTDKRVRVATFHHTGEEWQLTEVSAEPVPEGGAIPGRIEMKGQFGTAAGYKGCPGCGAGDYVHCGACDELGCWRRKEKFYTCANCGNHARVGGAIASLNAMDVA